MYHPEIVKRKIAAFIALGNPPPVYYPRFDIDRMTGILSSAQTLDEKGNVESTRPLSPQEIQFIRNERLLCKIDFRHWVSHYAWIKNEEDQAVRFIPWKSQEIFLDIMAENELEGISIELQVLKARQLGLSRITSLAILHRMLFFLNINAIIASSTPDKTGLLADMMEFTIDRIPWWMAPNEIARRSAAKGQGGIWWELDTGAGLTLQHGSQTSGIARGTTPTVAHISELCEFEYNGLGPDELIDSSLLRAMHPSQRILLVLESTALGQDNWWHKKWLSSKKGWPERRSRFRPVFLPWFVGGLYPKPDFLKKSPVPVPYRPAPWVIDHARRAAEYVSSNPLLTTHLGSGWTMPIPQQWFYEVERSQAMSEGKLNKFFQEMPASDDEAFQSTNISIFSTEVITTHRDNTRLPLDIMDPDSKPCAYGLLGPEDLVPGRLQPHPTTIDTGKQPIEITCNWAATSYPIRFTLVPLRWEGYSNDSGEDKIYLYEKPEDGQVYGFGVDTSDGIGKDLTSIEGIRKGGPYEPAGQICEFATSKLNALDTTPYALALATLYSVSPAGITYEEEIAGMESGQSRVLDGFGGMGSRRQCRVAIECKGSGDQTQLQMRLRGWHNFHPWQRIDNKKLDPSQYNKIGVFTNSWFRDAMMEYMLKMLRDMELEIRSPYFVKEMQSMEASEFNMSIKASHGATDDRFMSLGFAVISLYQWEKNRPVTVQRATTRPSNAPRVWARAVAGQQGRMVTLA